MKFDINIIMRSSHAYFKLYHFFQICLPLTSKVAILSYRFKLIHLHVSMQYELSLELPVLTRPRSKIATSSLILKV